MINDTLRDADQKMGKAVEVAREEFAAIRAGRANPSMFAKLTADYYGTPDADPAAGRRSPLPRRGSSSCSRTT